MATIMAMIAPMKAVPQNSGIDPKAGRSGLVGAQRGLGTPGGAEQEFARLTRLKKRRLSNSSDRTMPSVVRMAISEAPSSSPIAQRSTPVRARKSTLIRALKGRRQQRR